LDSRGTSPSRQAAKTAICEYPETFCNSHRLHPALGYKIR
jgi:hypothetical protein